MPKRIRLKIGGLQGNGVFMFQSRLDLCTQSVQVLCGKRTSSSARYREAAPSVEIGEQKIGICLA